MLTALPMTTSEALPPPSIHEEYSPVFGRPVGFQVAASSLNHGRASSEDDDVAAGTDDLMVAPEFTVDLTSDWESDVDARAPITLEKVVADVAVKEISELLQEVT